MLIVNQTQKPDILQFNEWESSVEDLFHMSQFDSVVDAFLFYNYIPI